jgi:hypothetical protein
MEEVRLKPMVQTMLCMVLYLGCLASTLSSPRSTHIGEHMNERLFLRPVDDGLVAASIHPYSGEWNKTFRPYETHVHGVKDLQVPSPVLFYFRCVDGVARIYFTIQDFFKAPVNNQPQGSELKVPLVLFKERIKLRVNMIGRHAYEIDYTVVRACVRACA